MSKMKQHRSKSASKSVSLNTFHAPIVAYAFWRLTLEARPKRFKLIFHTLEMAKQHHRKGGTHARADGPIQRLTSMPSKHQVALTRGIARKQQIQEVLNLIDRMSALNRNVLRYRQTLKEALRIQRKRVAFEEGLTEDGQLL